MAAAIVERNFESNHGELTIGGVGIGRLAADYGTPLFVYDRGVMARRLRTLRQTLPERFDVVFDVFGNLGYRRARRILTPTGRYLITVPTFGALAWHLLTLGSRGRRSRIAFTGLRKAAAVRADLAATRSLVETGRIRPVVDGVYPFAEARAAHEHVARGKAGHVILTP